MGRGFKMKLAMIAASLILAGSAQAQSLKEKYELSERCGKRAEETFARDWKKPPSGEVNYEAHYNARLNKCFYVEIMNFLQKGKVQRSLALYDLHENRQIGWYSGWGDSTLWCRVQERFCKTEKEWRAFVKPLMED